MPASMNTPLYQDRRHAGRVLAQALAHHAGQPGLRVLALPRGGVPVAYEVAQALSAPLDVFVVRKLGAPRHEELAIGAIAHGVRVLDDALVQLLGVSPEQVRAVAEAQSKELARREALYRAGRPPHDLQGATVILVDDGLATGASMRAAVQAVRAMGPAACVVAVPTGPAETCALLRREADEVVCASTPERFVAVGRWYRDFTQTTDEEVRELLAAA